MRLIRAVAMGMLASAALPVSAQRDPAIRRGPQALPPPSSPQPGAPAGYSDGYGLDPYAYAPPPIDYLPPPMPAGPSYRGGSTVRRSPDGGTVTTVTVGGTPAFVAAGEQPRHDVSGTGAGVTGTMTDPGFDPAPPRSPTRQRGHPRRP